MEAIVLGLCSSWGWQVLLFAGQAPYHQSYLPGSLILIFSVEQLEQSADFKKILTLALDTHVDYLLCLVTSP